MSGTDKQTVFHCYNNFHFSVAMMFVCVCYVGRGARGESASDQDKTFNPMVMLLLEEALEICGMFEKLL